MTSSERIRLRASLQFHEQALEKARAAYLALLDGRVKSYTIGPRSLTKLDLPELEAKISEHEAKIAELESVLSGGGRRKAIGVIRVDS